MPSATALDGRFYVCSHERMVVYGELSFKVVRLEPELRQGARVICKSKES
jgi:hypothetical protein